MNTGQLSARDLARAHDLARARALNRVIASVIARVIARVLTRARVIARALDRDLPADLADTLDFVSTLARDLALARAVRGQRGAGRVVPLAGRLLAAAARLLPAGDRARYAEEFRSELTEIARAGAGRRRQLAYAARVVMSARRLRADLRAPRRRRAAP